MKTPKLNLVWSANLTDTIINQFDDPDNQETGEHLFKEVLDRKDKLVQFNLLNLKSHRVYSVDLLNGRLNTYISGSCDSNPEPEVLGDSKYTYRLIYFRRVTREISQSGNTLKDLGVNEILYFLGFQYTNEKGENVKRLLQISEDDEVYLI